MTVMTLRPDPKLRRHRWPWKDMEIGDEVHVYGNARIFTKVYGSAGGYTDLKRPDKVLRCLRIYCPDGKDYIRVQAVRRGSDT